MRFRRRAAVLIGASFCLFGATMSSADEAAVPGGVQAVRSPGPRSLTVAATGDILAENPVLDAGTRAGAAVGAPYSFSPLFDQIRPIVSSAQLAICHMETPIGYPGQRAGYYGHSPYGGNLLLAPYEMAAAIGSAGFDRCTTSSNHSFDLGSPGIDSTLRAFDAAGVSHVGTARTPQEAVPQIMTVSGIKVAHLAYTRMSNTVRPTNSWQLSFAATPQQIAADVAAVRAAGAEIVIVSLHISRELQNAPAPDDRAFVTAMTAGAHVDLVIEHGPHVIQPVELVNGAVVYWSVGNLLSGMGQANATRYGPPTLDGLLAWVVFRETSPGHFSVEAQAVLVCNEIAGRVIYPAITTLNDPTITPALRTQLNACVARSRPIVPSIQ